MIVTVGITLTVWVTNTHTASQSVGDCNYKTLYSLVFTFSTSNILESLAVTVSYSLTSSKTQGQVQHQQGNTNSTSSRLLVLVLVVLLSLILIAIVILILIHDGLSSLWL